MDDLVRPGPSADLQMVNITLRVLSKPDVKTLAGIFRVRDGTSACGWRAD